MNDYAKYLALFEECLTQPYINSSEAGSYYWQIDGDTLKMWFQHTVGKSDWFNNFDFPKQAYGDTELPWKVHRGFLRVFKSIKPYIKNAIMDSRVKNIQVVGYSHGAALAMFCNEYCVYNRPDCKVEGYGFGCPRVLHGKYSDELLKRWENFTVIRNYDDIVSHMPPKLFGFTHVGQVVDLTPKWYYIKSEKSFKEKFVAGHRPQNIIAKLEEKTKENSENV